MTKVEKQLNIGWNLDNSYGRLPKMFFSILDPTPVSFPNLIKLNNPLAISLGLDVQELQSGDGVKILAGNEIPQGTLPLAQAYAGHQFGHFTMLGDGRAILIGEQITPTGERFDIQLKGSGVTPYSRRGDGRAALGPMLREYIISEAMEGLGIPTTRSLAVVTTGESILRETALTGAILTRVAASHIRVGTFQYAANWGTIEDIKALADYSIKRHYPFVELDENPYFSFLKEVIKRQAELISKWQLVGFVHGVMNTDNMTISGETIDYGPCAFMDTYSLKTVFSSIDNYGRYAYGNQPTIGSWNLTRLAEALLPLIHKDKDQAINLAQEAIEEYFKSYNNQWLTGMRKKLGIFNEEEQDESLVQNLLSMMEKYQADYTNTFVALTFDKLDDTPLFKTPEFQIWYGGWKERLKRQCQPKASSQQLMKNSNPAIIPRNHRVEEALELAVKNENYKVMDRLLDVLKNPYAHGDGQKEYAKLPEPSAVPYRTFCGT